MRNLTQVEGMSLEVLRAGIRWDFESVPQYLDMLERNGVGAQHRRLRRPLRVRTYVMGEAATERAATPENQAMKRAACWKRCAPGRSASPPAPRLRTTAAAASRCLAPRRRNRAAHAGRRLREAGAACSCSPRAAYPHPVPRGAGARLDAPGGDRRAAPQQHQPDAVFTDLDAIAERTGERPLPVGAVSCCPLSMDFTLRSPYVFEGCEPGKPALPLKASFSQN
jgi:hypothetical protein